MPVQQIVYHMLRVFMKDEGMTDSADKRRECGATLSNYHIKTLMLWHCEILPKIRWTDNLHLIKICVQLLHTLGERLTDSWLTHYFVNNCNLIDNSLNVINIVGRSVDVTG